MRETGSTSNDVPEPPSVISQSLVGSAQQSEVAMLSEKTQPDGSTPASPPATWRAIGSAGGSTKPTQQSEVAVLSEKTQLNGSTPSTPTGTWRGVKPISSLNAMFSEKSILMRYRPTGRYVRDSRAYKTIAGMCLALALVGADLWQLFDIPDDPGNAILDTLMILVFTSFLFDMCVLTVAENFYIGSFFFWMDILGSASIAFDVSFLLSPAGEMNTPDTDVDASVMRAARIAKLGARSGRLAKLLKCLHFIFGGDIADDSDEARVLAAKLSHYLSTKAALLTILFAVVYPCFSLGLYPEDDLSLRSWAQRIENEYRLAAIQAGGIGGTSLIFEKTVLEMRKFYSDLNYRPYRIQGYEEQLLVGATSLSIPGSSLMSGGHPARLQNVVRQDVDHCIYARPSCSGGSRPAIYFDFTGAHQMMAVADIAQVLFIIGVMVVMSFLLMTTVKGMVVVPVDRMLRSIRSSASSVMRGAVADNFQRLDTSNYHEDEMLGGGLSELAVVELVFERLKRIIEIFSDTVTGNLPVGALDDEEAGVLDLMAEDDLMRGCMHPGFSGRASQVQNRYSRVSAYGSMTVGVTSFSRPQRNLKVDTMVFTTWSFNVLEVAPEDLNSVMFYLYFDTAMGRMAVAPQIEEVTFAHFHDAVMDSYHDAPYHNYSHACDVSFTVHRLLSEAHCEEWVPDVEVFALLMAAFCHDLGHQGRTNPFLVETCHELALLYNDKSPLENMHVSKMFEICSAKQEANVFHKFSKEDFKQARKVCVACILHTDNVHHFDMVKTLQSIYELHTQDCEAQASRHDGTLDERYVGEVLDCHLLTWLELFLHMADVSNPLKPFKICQAWAWRVLDEFFAQGDEEKELGLPVGMLNDREKINRPHSQHGFIKFLVAPFATVSVKIFPSLHPLTTNMASNFKMWREMWVSEYNPPSEDVEIVDRDAATLQADAEYLYDRCYYLSRTPSERTSLTPSAYEPYDSEDNGMKGTFSRRGSVA